mmetsp:Transcript_23192/g.64809  ORF Transcript_23192/g.64809 Transcript_23192/m.64809 type:complete len:423 (-) Transcript_23192:54-1322(-)
MGAGGLGGNGSSQNDLGGGIFSFLLCRPHGHGNGTSSRASRATWSTKAAIGEESPDGRSHPNAAWWTNLVWCVKVEEVPAEGEETRLARYCKFEDEAGHAQWAKMTIVNLGCPPFHNLGRHLQRNIRAFTELRQAYFNHQPRSWITYHAWIILEVAGCDLFIVCEKKTDRLELMIGEGQIVRLVAKHFRVNGTERDAQRYFEQPRQVLDSKVTVCQLLEWLDGPLSDHWEMYDMLWSNCQHFTTTLEAFLLDPGSAKKASKSSGKSTSSASDPGFRALSAVRADHTAMQSVPEELLADRDFVMAALKQNWRALRYASDKFRQDRDVVLAAVAQDAHALRYASAGLRQDHDMVLAAARRKASALSFAPAELRRNRDFILAVVRENGHALRYTTEELRKDRDVVLAAVQQTGFALRYAAVELPT